MRDIIRHLLSEPDIEVVAESTGDVDLADLAGATRADVVVMGLADTRLSQAGRRLLVRHPGIRLVGVAADGRKSVLYELSARRRSLGEVSSKTLVAAVRGSRRRHVPAKPH